MNVSLDRYLTPHLLNITVCRSLSGVFLVPTTYSYTPYVTDGKYYRLINTPALKKFDDAAATCTAETDFLDGAAAELASFVDATAALAFLNDHMQSTSNAVPYNEM